MQSKLDFSVDTLLSNVSQEQFRTQVARIKNSGRFSAAKQLQVLLEILAEHILSAAEKPITQKELGVALQLRNFDSTKPTVRIVAGRLRSALRDFYMAEGRDDSILINFPRGRPYRLEARQRVKRIVPRSDAAFKKYNEGRMLWAQRTPLTLKQAVRCFEEAIKLDPKYPDPHTALAECYLFMALSGMAPRDVMPLGKKHALEAVRLDPFSAEAHAGLGGILSSYEWNWAKAWKEFDRAFELDEYSVTALCWRATHLLSVGNPEGASQDAHLTLKLTSSSPSALINTHAAKILYAAREYDQAEKLLLAIREAAPDFYLAHWQLGLVWASKGNISAALEALDMAARVVPDGPGVLASLGWIQASAGNVDRAEQIVADLRAQRKLRYIPATDLAMIYGTIGKVDLAFQWLKRALREKALFLSWLSVWPPFEPLHKNPMSAGILRRMKLDGIGVRRK